MSRVNANLAKFQTVVSAILGVAPEQVDDRLSPESVDSWDSLNQINILSALEQEFGVTLPVANVADHLSVSRLKRLLRDHGVEF